MGSLITNCFDANLYVAMLQMIYPVHTVIEFGADINPNTDVAEWSGIDWTLGRRVRIILTALQAEQPQQAETLWIITIL